MKSKSWEDAARIAKAENQRLKAELEISKSREQTALSREEAAITKQGIDKFFSELGKNVIQQAHDNAIKDENIASLEKCIIRLKSDIRHHKEMLDLTNRELKFFKGL